MAKQIVSTEWLYNLMMKPLGEEAYQKWEAQIPESFLATLDYLLYAAFSERDEGIIRKHYQEHCKTREIAEHDDLCPIRSVQGIGSHGEIACYQDHSTWSQPHDTW